MHTRSFQWYTHIQSVLLHINTHSQGINTHTHSSTSHSSTLADCRSTFYTYNLFYLPFIHAHSFQGYFARIHSVLLNLQTHTTTMILKPCTQKLYSLTHTQTHTHTHTETVYRELLKLSTHTHTHTWSTADKNLTHTHTPNHKRLTS